MDARDSTTASPATADTGPTTAGPTAANADLWAAYFRPQWRAWFEFAGMGRAADDMARAASEAAGATVAAIVSAWIGPPVDRLYADNAPAVTAFIEAATTSVASAPPHESAVPPQYARAGGHIATGASQLEDWRIATRSGTESAVLAY